MNEDWEKFKGMKGWHWTGIYAGRMDTFFKKDLSLICVDPVLEFKHPYSTGICYFKLDWTENEPGDHLLFVHAQKTPAPVNYEQSDHPEQKYLILDSGFSCEPNLVKRLIGYGFEDEGGIFLSEVVMELEERFITIKTGAVIEVHVTEKKPEGLGECIFSS
ncbi:hypothetical protein MUN89_20645 [Halobacillus salinarum]|uniref:Uncharacterized protein n=1 Tax=Halobacillus salinarum TaxID=2932257 RepID=A0ABY4EQ53_9BACI|nr:hypothetical protein [Halobacillus salinarum]UOQ44231.1 hypothetical protein MUN89_20645 [Halobacillus salinarum]